MMLIFVSQTRTCSLSKSLHEESQSSELLPTFALHALRGGSFDPKISCFSLTRSQIYRTISDRPNLTNNSVQRANPGVPTGFVQSDSIQSIYIIRMLRLAAFFLPLLLYSELPADHDPQCDHTQGRDRFDPTVSAPYGYDRSGCRSCWKETSGQPLQAASLSALLYMTAYP